MIGLFAMLRSRSFVQSFNLSISDQLVTMLLDMNSTCSPGIFSNPAVDAIPLYDAQTCSSVSAASVMPARLFSLLRPTEKIWRFGMAPRLVILSIVLVERRRCLQLFSRLRSLSILAMGTTCSAIGQSL